MSPDQSDPCTSDLAPIFCGGTERSGTTIVARLVAAHPAYALVPIEARFHTDARGLPDLLAGRIELAEFRRRMRRVWYRRKLRNGGLRGMFHFLPEERFEATLERFCSDFAQEPLPAARDLVNGLFGPVVEARRRSVDRNDATQRPGSVDARVDLPRDAPPACGTGSAGFRLLDSASPVGARQHRRGHCVVGGSRCVMPTLPWPQRLRNACW